MTEVELCVMGGGRMGTALVGGILAAGVDPGTVAVAEIDASRRAALADELPGVTVTESAVRCRSGIVAVKPGVVSPAARALADAGAQRILSIAAGVTLETLRDATGPGPALIRAMPNTPALVGAGASAIAGDDPEAVAWAHEVLSAVGVVVTVEEAALDAVTGLSGSGPAYVFLVAEALVEAGVLVGLSRDVSATLAGQTLLGAARLLTEGELDAAALRAQVTSPGGTTAAGLRALERSAVRAAVADAVVAATERSRELGS